MRRNRLALDSHRASGRACCATSARSIPRSRCSAASSACRCCFAPVGSLECFHPRGGRRRGARRRRVRRRPHAELGLRARPREGRRGRARRAALLPALRARRRRLGRRLRARARSTTATPPSASPSTPRSTAGASATSPSAMSWPGRRKASGREFQAALDWRTVERIKKKLQHPARHQGHRDRRGRQARGRARRRLDLRLQPRRPPARPRPRLDGRAARGGRRRSAGRAKVIVDGGFARGTDIVKAIAAGADLVGLGRLQCYALAAGGAGRARAAARAARGRGAALPRHARRHQLRRARPQRACTRRRR